MSKPKILEMQGEVLFDNEEGLRDNITLSDSLQKYKYIEIFYKRYTENPEGEIFNSIKIDNPSDKRFSLTASLYTHASRTLQIQSIEYICTNNLISLLNPQVTVNINVDRELLFIQHGICLLDHTSNLTKEIGGEQV